MNKKNTEITQQLKLLQQELEHAITEHQTIKEELEQFLSQFTCVLDAPSCSCTEEESNDPKMDALFTEQDRLTKLTKSASQRVSNLKQQISLLESALEDSGAVL